MCYLEHGTTCGGGQRDLFIVLCVKYQKRCVNRLVLSLSQSVYEAAVIFCLIFATNITQVHDLLPVSGEKQDKLP